MFGVVVVVVVVVVLTYIDISFRTALSDTCMVKTVDLNTLGNSRHPASRAAIDKFEDETKYLCPSAALERQHSIDIAIAFAVVERVCLLVFSFAYF